MKYSKKNCAKNSRESNMATENLIYKPSLVARMARIFIPLLQNLLPKALYRRVYDILYFVYKSLLNKLYIFRVLEPIYSVIERKNYVQN